MRDARRHDPASLATSTPTSHLDRAMARRNLVLDSDGRHRCAITAAKKPKRAKAEPIKPRAAQRRRLRSPLLRRPRPRRNRRSASGENDSSSTTALRIYTSLDPELQKVAASEAVEIGMQTRRCSSSPQSAQRSVGSKHHVRRRSLSSRSTRIPARCSRWSAAATTPARSSTTRSPSALPAPSSSRSSTPRPKQQAVRRPARSPAGTFTATHHPA